MPTEEVPEDRESRVEVVMGPQKACRNMRGVQFDGFTEDEREAVAAWQDILRREGKWVEGAGSLRDLMPWPLEDQ